MIPVGQPMARRTRAMAITVVLAWVSAAWAQDSNRLDFRVNHQGAADANNQVGSGGRNNPLIPSYVANSANLYITGNVTGGRSFQAFSPVSDPTVFSIGLESSSLDNFRRDSASLGGILSGRTSMVTTPYYSRHQTTTSLGTLSAGFQRLSPWPTEGVFTMPNRTPAFTMPRYGIPYAEPLTRPLASTSVRAGQLTVPLPEPSPFLEPLPAAPSLLAGAAPWLGLTSLRRPATGTFGLTATVPVQRFSEGAAEQVTPFDTVAFPDSVDLVGRSAIGPERGEGEPEQPDEALWPGPGFAERLFPAQPEVAGAEPETPTRITPGGEAAPEAIAGSVPGVPQFAPTGADAYWDMVTALLFLTDAERNQTESRSPGTVAPDLADRYQRDLSAARNLLSGPIESFAGSGDDLVQNHVRTAEQLVRQGKYYQAKTFYDRALIFDRNNPLVLLGQGHTMLAAGEYYSAALKLSRAIELLPAIAYCKFDLRTFIPEPDLLETRRADLEERLETREDHRFRFVLGYAEYYSGLAKYGLPNLKQAAEQAPKHSGIARLYELLSKHTPVNDD